MDNKSSCLVSNKLMHAHNTVRLLGTDMLYCINVYTYSIIIMVHLFYFNILFSQAPKPIQQTDNAPPPPQGDVSGAVKVRVRGKFDFKSVSDYCVCACVCALNCMYIN